MDEVDPTASTQTTGSGFPNPEKNHSIFAKIDANNKFENTTLLIIVINALWICVDVEWNHSRLMKDGKLPLEPVSTVVENLFCLYFTFEVLIRLFAVKTKLFCIFDAWFVFDSVLVTFMVLETWALPIVDHYSSGSGSGCGVLSDFSSFRLLRLLLLTPLSRMRIVCFPHSGHAKTAYSALAVWLSEHKIEVITVSAPRSEDQHGEAPAIDWRVLIDKTCEALKDCGLIDSVPYAFFGHSLGAVLAYSVAVQLDRDLAPGHARPLHIFASSHGPPWTAGPARRGASDGHTVWTSFTNVSDYELLFTLAKFGHFPEQVTSQDEFLTVVFPALRADFQVYETHEFEAGRPLPVAITVVDFSENWAVPMELLSCWVDGRDNFKFTSGHFFIASCLSEFVSTVVSHLKESISALRPPTSTSQYQIQDHCKQQSSQEIAAQQPIEKGQCPVLFFENEWELDLDIQRSTYEAAPITIWTWIEAPVR